LQKRKLLIAQSAEEQALALAELFRGICQVRVCTDGGAAMELLSRFQPDVLVLDLMLPGYDGLSLLQWARDQGLRPQVLATTRFCSDYVLDTAQNLGVRYLMRKPCSVSALTARIRDLLERECPPEQSVRKEETEISGLLAALSIPGKLRGCTYLRCAVPLYAADPLQSVTKVLYPQVAKCCGCEASHVERSIRSAIEAGWKHRDDNIWRLYFPAGATGLTERPTNSAFIAALAGCLTRSREDFLQNAEIVQNIPKIPPDVRE
jgi:two-component system response regulator (stage 0 sporulation protein A)